MDTDGEVLIARLYVYDRGSVSRHYLLQLLVYIRDMPPEIL